MTSSENYSFSFTAPHRPACPAAGAGTAMMTGALKFKSTLGITVTA